jgi:protein gp37
VPARVRFLSIEPMLGPINLCDLPGTDRWRIDALAGAWERHNHNRSFDDAEPNLERHQGAPRLSWVIAGGESGPHARPAHPDWFRSLRDQCATAGVPFLFKQWGEWVSADCLDTATQTAVWRGRDHFEMERAGLIRRWKQAKPSGPPHFACDHWLRAGKKAAGRQLDGVQHDGFPR